jgi:predicted AlkP superfamily phosphohydrolase/phosphomutase
MLPAALLVGAAGGALLGGAIAGAVLLLADLSRVPRDLLALTLYFVLPLALLGAAAGGAMALGTLGIARARGRTLQTERFLARLAILSLGGAVVAVASCVWVVASRPALLASGWILLPIVVAVGVLLTAAYVAGRPDATGRGPRLAVLLAVMAGSLGVPPVAGYFRPAVVGDTPTPGEPAMVKRDGGSPPPRVLLLGWDGATWNVIDPLIRQGKMPALARLVAGGSRGEIIADPQVIQPFANSASAGARTPPLWETVATGKHPLHHGIWDFQCKLFAGMEQAVPFRIAGNLGGRAVPTTSDMARAERVWHMLDRAGLPVTVVAWPNTWPARRPAAHGVITSALAQEDGLPDTVQPPGAIDVTALCRDVDAESIATERRIFGLPGDASSPPPWETAPTWLERDLLRTFHWDYAEDLCTMRVALELAGRERPQFLAVYLSLTDIVQHKFWRYREPERFENVPPEHVARYGRTIDLAYEYFDAELARLLEAMGDDTVTIVLADHGAGPWVFDGLQGWLDTFLKRSHPEYSGNHRLNAMLALQGPGIVRGGRVEAPEHVDVTPTILHLFGLPVGRDMPGRVLHEVLDGDARRRPPAAIASYESPLSRGGFRPTASEVDAEVEDKLRALGYVQ